MGHKHSGGSGRKQELDSIAKLWGITIEQAIEEDNQSLQAGDAFSDRVAAVLAASGARQRHIDQGESTKQKRFGAILDRICQVRQGLRLTARDATGEKIVYEPPVGPSDIL
jgi:hypothetical protein